MVKSVLIVFLVSVTAASLAVHWKPNYPDREQFARGAYVYEQNCLLCHGKRGDGRGEMAPTLVPKPRSFRTGIFKYRSTPPGKLPTNADLTRVVREGLAGTGMGTFGERLSASEIEAVVEYVKSFSLKWKHEENYAAPVPIPDLPPWWANTSERAAHIETGRQAFRTTCVSCHGEDADGRGIAAASLRDDWGEAITPANLLSPVLHAGSQPQDLFRVLTVGIGGTPMASFQDAIPEGQRWDIVAYVESVRTARRTLESKP